MSEKYKGFELKGSTLRKECEVAINLGDKRHHIATGDTMDDAYIAARAWVNWSFAAAKQGRRETHVATAEQYETYPLIPSQDVAHAEPLVTGSRHETPLNRFQQTDVNPSGSRIADLRRGHGL